MYCRYCGTKNIEEAIFCERCGRRIVEGQKERPIPTAEDLFYTVEPDYREGDKESSILSEEAAIEQNDDVIVLEAVSAESIKGVQSELPGSLLTVCAACGGKVSIMAKTCPHCGHPVPGNKDTDGSRTRQTAAAQEVYRNDAPESAVHQNTSQQSANPVPIVINNQPSGTRIVKMVFGIMFILGGISSLIGGLYLLITLSQYRLLAYGGGQTALFFILGIVLLIIGIVLVRSDDSEITDPLGFKYKKNQSGLTLVSAEAAGENVRIPESSNFQPVTAIEQATFSPGVKTVTVGRSISKIGSYAFSNLSFLTEVVFEGQALEIDAAAFRVCPSLNKLIFAPGAVVRFSYTSFFECSALESIDLSKCAMQCVVVRQAFVNCDSLKSIIANRGSSVANDCSKVMLPTGSYIDKDISVIRI